MTRRPPTTFKIAVDLVILTIRDDQVQVLLVRRRNAPYEGCAALPGGFVRFPDDLLATAARELQEETGLTADRLHLDQLRTYVAVDRDPRGPIASVAYLAVASGLPLPVAGSDAASASWTPLDDLGRCAPALAFDHAQILRDGVERAREMLERTPLAAAFCEPRFTMTELRQVYEAFWGMPLDPANFHRKATSVPGFLVATRQQRGAGSGRPATLYQLGEAPVLDPPILRPRRLGAAPPPRAAAAHRGR